MRKEYEQKMDELKKSTDASLDERLDASVKRILQQNRRMAEELKIHVQVWGGGVCRGVCRGVWTMLLSEFLQH